jgi:hypothetical protein
MIPGWFTGISIRAVLIAVAAIALVLVGAFRRYRHCGGVWRSF